MWKSRVAASIHEGISLFRKYPMELFMGLVTFMLICRFIAIEEHVVVTQSASCADFFFVASLSLLAFVLGDLKGYVVRILYFFIPVLLLAVWLSFGLSRYVTTCEVQFYTWFAIVALAFWWVSSSDNRLFAQRTASKIRSLFYASVVGLLSFLLFLGIDYSIRYIFDAMVELSTVEMYVGVFLLCVVPLFVFLSFDERQPFLSRYPHFVNVLLKFVVTPALLIYNLIFYVYLAKILVTGSLPKGGIAVFALIYIFTALACKVLSELSAEHPFSWFYRYFRYIALPAVLMFWWATAYRIQAYGFTQPRVYLVVLGVAMTVILLLLICRRMTPYRYFILVVAVGLAAVAYVPSFTAIDIERRSQYARFDALLVQRGLLDENGKIIPERLEAEKAGVVLSERATDNFWQLLSYMQWTARGGADYVAEKYGYTFEELNNK
ncbi:MAG: DUF4153 domain-containing protein [Alistipes sp.]